MPTGSISASPTSPALGERDDVNGLETWDDPTPRRSHRTIKDLRAAVAAASKAQRSTMPKRPTREERVRKMQDRQRNVLVTALNKYAKQNNIQPGQLEFVEVKGGSLVSEISREYVHYNFLVLVKEDGAAPLPTMFFAEVKPDCQGEEDVYHCTPLEDTDAGVCVACNRGPEDLMHPTAGGYLGGHEENGSIYMRLVLDSDDEVDYM